MNATCRRLTPADYDAAFALYQVLSTGATLPDHRSSKGAFATLLAHTGTDIWAAQLPTGGLVSMATLHVLPNMTYGARPYALVENVATLPDHQSQGYAGARYLEVRLLLETNGLSNRRILPWELFTRN